MKFAIVTDVHIGPYRLDYGIHRKATIHAEKLLKDFVRAMNDSFRPDFVVQGGDLIEDVNRAVDRKNLIKGLRILSRLNCPVYHLIGNHERRCLTITDIKELHGQKRPYFSFDKDGFRFVFLFTKPGHPESKISLDQTQLAWLKQKLVTAKKIVLFSHHSLIPVNTRGNFWFSRNPQATFIRNHRQFLKIIKHKNVKVAFNSHLHWNRKKIVNGVPYITVQSLIENTSGKMEGPPAKAYTLVKLSDNVALIHIKGVDERQYRLKI